MKCPNCNSETLSWRSRCPVCGESLHKDEEVPQNTEKQHWKNQQSIAGVLNLLVGLGMLIFLSFYTVMAGNKWDWDKGMLGVLSLFFIAAGLVLVSGVFALRGTQQKFVLAGAIISFFIPVVGLAGGLMMMLSREDWSKVKRRTLIAILTILGVPVSLFLGLCFISVIM